MSVLLLKHSLNLLNYLIDVLVCHGFMFLYVLKKLSHVRAKAGKQGGSSKAEVYRVIQDKLVYLINESVPEGGWKSKAAAVNALIDPLWDFIKESNFDINNESKNIVSQQ